MNKFYILSALLHGIILVSIFSISKEDELKFKEKNTITVSVKNRKAISNYVETSSTNESIKDKEDVKVEENEKKLLEDKLENKNTKIEPIKKEPIKKIVKKEKLKETNLGSTNKANEKKEQYNEFKDKNRFLQGEDGVFTAVSLEGIEYEIIKEVDPQYPIKARKIGYNNIGLVKVRFFVELDGSVKNIEFISGENKFGFKEEVEKALKKWKFKPIVYKEKIIRVHFEKEFKFKKN